VIRFRHMRLTFIYAAVLAATALVVLAQPGGSPGKLQKMPWGGRLHIQCIGHGSPAVVFETGFQDFSFTWSEVQRRLSATTKVCVYDRAGYAWSDAGPEPRTLAQLNMELRELLRRQQVRPPYVLAGHSFGGNVVRSYAELYPKEIAGVVLVDAVHPEQQISMGGGKTARLFELAQGRPIPAPHWRKSNSAARAPKSEGAVATQTLPEPFQRLPPRDQEAYRYFSRSALLPLVERSQGTWSEETMAIWKKTPPQLGSTPILVLSRSRGNDSSRETERLRLQESMAASPKGVWRTLPCGHNMHLECPESLVAEILKFEPLAPKRRQ
jgi:pimeloyl-ACP methyl ester carboxylesterase